MEAYYCKEIIFSLHFMAISEQEADLGSHNYPHPEGIFIKSIAKVEGVEEGCDFHIAINHHHKHSIQLIYYLFYAGCNYELDAA